GDDRSGRAPPLPWPVAPGSPVQIAQLVLGSFQARPALPRQGFAGAVDVEREHGHGGTIRIALAPVAALGRPLERAGNAARVILGEDPLLEVKGVAGLGDAL